MIAYKLGDYGKVTEFSYDKETECMFTGVKKLRDITGTCYHMPSRIDKWGVFKTALEALDTLKDSVEKVIHSRLTELGQINKAIEENS